MTSLRVLAAWVLMASAAAACEDVTWEDIPFTVCTAEIGDDLRLFHSNESGEVYGNFQTLEADVGPLAFAMNAGMFHQDRSPVGLYQEAGNVTSNIVLRAGPGNFGMLPNGVFCIAEGRIEVLESSTYQPENCRDATQSGPMLVIGGALHPRLLPKGTSKFIRNGVGTNATQDTAYFVISNVPVNFYDFARLFKDHLGTPNALYFDGNVSRLHAPVLSRSDFGRMLGPIVGVVK